MLKYKYGKESERQRPAVAEKRLRKKEIEFELRYLLSLTIQERFQLMQKKSSEMLALLEQNGHQKTTEVIKRK